MTLCSADCHMGTLCMLVCPVFATDAVGAAFEALVADLKGKGKEKVSIMNVLSRIESHKPAKLGELKQSIVYTVSFEVML